jgi:anti-sigma factor RsiW
MFTNRERQGMSHFTEGVLQAYLDNEVAADARAQVAAHVGGCTACATRLQELRELNETFASALRVIDSPVIPAAALAEIRARAARRSWRERFAGSSRTLTRAALLVLGLTLAAAAAVPGSPLRQWLVQAWQNLTQTQEVPAPPVVTPAPRPEPAPTATRLEAAAGRIRITLRSPSPDTRIHVLLIEGTRALVESTGNAAARRTATGSGWLELTGTGAGELRISLPRGVPNATIEIDGKAYLIKEGDDLRYLGASADTAGAELIFRPGH